MAKYIDADRLRAEIERRMNAYAGDSLSLGCTTAMDGFEPILEIIDSLQQEQTDMGEVSDGKPELTWEDIAKIDALILEANNEFAVDYSKEISREQFYTEVLNRFNKSKEEV